MSKGDGGLAGCLCVAGGCPIARLADWPIPPWPDLLCCPYLHSPRRYAGRKVWFISKRGKNPGAPAEYPREKLMHAYNGYCFGHFWTKAKL